MCLSCCTTQSWFFPWVGIAQTALLAGVDVLFASESHCLTCIATARIRGADKINLHVVAAPQERYRAAGAARAKSHKCRPRSYYNIAVGLLIR